MTWEHLATIKGETYTWYAIGNTSTFHHAYPVEWHTSKEMADESIKRHNLRQQHLMPEKQP